MIRYLARLSVQNPVAVNLGTIAVVAAGLMAFLQMPREVFPEATLGTVTITTLYPAAAPEDVERLVTLPLEEQLEGLEGRKDLVSVSQEGYSLLTLTAQTGTDMSDFVEDVRTAVRSGDLELPGDSEEPLVQEIKAEFPVIGFFVYGQGSEEQLRLLAEGHRRALERIEGVSQVIMQGHREPRIWVEVQPDALERFGLTLEQVGSAVRGRSTDAPVGTLETGSGDYILRVDAGVQRAEDLRDLFVVQHGEGSGIRLSEVARVVDTYERRTTVSRFNGQPSVYLRVTKKSRGDAISISRGIYDHIEETQSAMPAGTAIGTNSDLSIYVRNRLNVMRDSALVGGVLVLISLILFLNIRIALLTALGIPIAFLGGLVLAFSVGLTMNMLTMFALIVVLGMIVDDAIVVGENAYRLMEEGLSPEEAAVQGTAEVGKAVMATIFTTIAAFMPLLMLNGTMGSFMRPLPLIVSFCLLASLVEALAVLPSHLAHWTGKPKPRVEGGRRRWYEPLRDVYVRCLGWALDYRYVTLVGTAVLIGLMILFAKVRVPFVMFDDFESKVFSVNLRMVPGTSMTETDRVAAALESQIQELSVNEVESTNVIAGVSFADATRFTVGQNLAQVWVELREDVEGRRSTSEIIEDLRARFRELPPGVESIELQQPQAGPTGRALEVSLRGPDLEVLHELSADLQGFIASFAGTRDIHDSSDAGKREVRLRLTESGRLMGFSEASLAREMRAAFTGTRFARVRRGKDDVEIIVKLPEETRLDRGELERIPVARPASLQNGVGAELNRPVPLGMLAELYEAVGPSVISRDDGERAVTVSADVNKSEGNAAAIAAAIREYCAQPGRIPAGYDYAFKGEQEEADQSFSGIGIALVISLFSIYMILGTLFRSMLQPIVIMGAIFFGLVGMVLGHVVMERPMSFLSMIGFVALTGIVVNDSLILQDFINRKREAGLKLRAAILVAGHQRFRPIVLTSVTTMLGLSPLTFFASGQARFLQPMAITIFFGLGCSTVLILIVVPCAYGVLDDVIEMFRRTWSRLFSRPQPDLSISPDN